MKFLFLLIFQLYFCLIIEIKSQIIQCHYFQDCKFFNEVGSACNAFALASAANEGPQYLAINRVIVCLIVNVYIAY